MVNNLSANSGEEGSILGLRKFPGDGIGYLLQYSQASLMAQTVKNLPAMQETWVRSLGQEVHQRRERQFTPVLLPREFHEQRSLVRYSPWGCKESNMTEQLSSHIIWCLLFHSIIAVTTEPNCFSLSRSISY